MHALPLAVFLALCLTTQLASALGTEPEPHATEVNAGPEALRVPRFEIGARLEVAYLEHYLGVDIGYRPSKFVGVGVMLGYGTFDNSDLSMCYDRCRDAQWAWVSPYLEGRLGPSGFVSPYGRIAVGIATGTFTHYSSDPSGTELRGHAELGVDFHSMKRGFSFRLFIGESVGPSNKHGWGSILGIPGIGAQLGFRF